MSATGRTVSGAVEYIKGKLQRMMGKATGSKRTQLKGMGNQAKGGAKYESGKAQRKIQKH